jgi:hypothetical protein
VIKGPRWVSQGSYKTTMALFQVSEWRWTWRRRHRRTHRRRSALDVARGSPRGEEQLHRLSRDGSAAYVTVHRAGSLFIFVTFYTCTWPCHVELMQGPCVHTSCRDILPDSESFSRNWYGFVDRLCGLVARVPGWRARGPGSIPGATKLSEN